MAAMLRSLGFAALATVSPLAEPARAQVQEPERLVVLLRDPNGKPVAGAKGFVETRDQGGLVALDDVATMRRADFHDAVRRRQLLTGDSDERGVLRFAGDEPQNGCAGSGMVWTEAGLGALLFDVQPGRAERVELQPMAAVTTATGTEPLQVFARATSPEGRVLTVPGARQGTTVRLPAGLYELWIHSPDEGWVWERRLLTPTSTTAVDFMQPGRRVRLAELVHPQGWPHVTLGGGEATVLRGAAASALLVGFRDQRFHGPALPPDARDGEPARWPAADATERFQLVPPPDVPGAALFLVQQRGVDDWRVLAAADLEGSRSQLHPDAPAQWFSLPPSPGGDTWLLFVARGLAPQAKSWLPGDRTFPFALERGVPLQVLARDEHGLPIVDLAVDYTPTDMDAARVRGASDGRGTARLGPVLAPGVLRVSDPRFANQELELAVVPQDGATVTVTAGARLRGVARWPDGSAAAGTVVTVRDPSGSLRPAQRSAVADANGAFTFGGLTEQRPLVLFASARRGGRTWSAKLDRLRAGGDDVELIVRDEDPQLGPASDGTARAGDDGGKR